MRSKIKNNLLRVSILSVLLRYEERGQVLNIFNYVYLRNLHAQLTFANISHPRIYSHQSSSKRTIEEIRTVMYEKANS